MTGWELAGAPGYWPAETTGVLRPAVVAYLNGSKLSEWQIAALRAYLRQWIDAPVWVRPGAGVAVPQWLAELRAGVDELTTRQAISLWLEQALECGIDPL